MNRRGFTIVELIIVITIMGVLLVLGVVNLRSTQVNGRDAERKADIEAIALNLEAFYKSGTEGSVTLGRYPSKALIGQEQFMLRDLDPKSLSAPGLTGSSLLAAAINTQDTTSILPSPTISSYVYQTLQADGSECVDETKDCRQFNLYYRLEGDDTVYMVSSKNR